MTQAQIDRAGEDQYVLSQSREAQMFGQAFSEHHTRAKFRDAVIKKRQYDEAVELWKISFENQEKERVAESIRVHQEAHPDDS